LPGLHPRTSILLTGSNYSFWLELFLVPPTDTVFKVVVRNRVLFLVHPRVIDKLSSVVLYPLFFVIYSSLLLLICQSVLKLSSLFCFWTNFQIITLWQWSSLVWLVCIQHGRCLVLVEFDFYIVLFVQGRE